MSPRKRKPQLPELLHVEMFWVDERIRTPSRKKVPGKAREVNCPRGTLRNPGVAVFESRDHQRVLQWVEARKREGWVTAMDIDENRQLMAILIRAAQRGRVSDGTYNANMVHKTSGKALKGSRKPVRDYRAPASVKNNGTVIGTRVKGAYGA